MDRLVRAIREAATPEFLDETRAHEIIYPKPHPRYDPSLDYKQAAVLVSLIEQGDSICTTLIQRTAQGTHGGQIAFPGGALESQDEDLAATAVREFEEEVGVPDMQVIAALSPLYIPVSRYQLSPYVGYSPSADPTFVAQPSEVAAILSMELDELIDLPLIHRTMDVRGQEITVLGFEWEDYFIWGATAMILVEFQILCKKVF